MEFTCLSFSSSVPSEIAYATVTKSLKSIWPSLLESYNRKRRDSTFNALNFLENKSWKSMKYRKVSNRNRGFYWLFWNWNSFTCFYSRAVTIIFFKIDQNGPKMAQNGPKKHYFWLAAASNQGRFLFHNWYPSKWCG